MTYPAKAAGAEAMQKAIAKERYSRESFIVFGGCGLLGGVFATRYYPPVFLRLATDIFIYSSFSFLSFEKEAKYYHWSRG